jgi:hypothetical protein
VFNAQIFTSDARILKQVDLDLTLNAGALNSAARVAGENFFVLHENDPTPFWKPGSIPISQVLRSAVWWTRIGVADQDQFFPVDSGHPRRSHIRLNCTTGSWNGQKSYSVDCWTNPAWGSSNMTGAVVELCGLPPKHLRPIEKGEVFTAKPSLTKGRPVRPLFYHRAGILEYVWFTHGAAIPAVYYDLSVGLLNNVRFTSHRDTEAIHVRQAGRLVGLIWPCTISAPEVIASAQRQLTSGNSNMLRVATPSKKTINLCQKNKKQNRRPKQRRSQRPPSL